MNKKNCKAEIIGKRLKKIRKSKGLTRAKVAEETGITNSALANYENGIRIPRDEAKKALSNYYNISIDIFFV